MQDAGDKIVSMFSAERPSFPAIAEVDAYWEGLRDGRLMPDRAEVDPRGLEGALEFAFILEHIAPGVGRIRVAGMHLSDILGMEVRGMPLTALFAPEARGKLARALEAVVSEPQVADLTLSSGRGIGRPGLNARLYLAPLAAPGQSIPRVLGCLQCIGDIGRTPRRFDIDKVQMRRIVATSAQTPRRKPITQKPAMPAMPGFAELGSTLTFASTRRSRTENAPQKPMLRLVK